MEGRPQAPGAPGTPGTPGTPADRSDAAYRACFEQLDVPQNLTALDGTLLDVNRAFCRLVARPADELVHLPVSSLWHRSDDGSADEEVRRLLAGEVEAIQVERVLDGPGGRPVPALVDLTLLRDEEGRPFAGAAVLRDLSALRSLERRHQQQEDFHLALAQRASDLAIVVDATGTLLYASPALGELLGYRVEDVLGSPAVTLVHEDDVTASRELVERVLSSGVAETSQLRVRHSSGRVRWFECTVANLVDTAVGGLVLNLGDITERVEAVQALQASEARYRAIADSAEEGIWAVTRDGATLYANQRMADILGLPLETVYARRVASVLRDGAVAPAAQRWAGRWDRGPERYSLTYRHPDGRPRVLWISAAPLEAVGAPQAALAMVSDVTEERRLEDQLQHAALHDELTGLPNRALLLDRLQHALEVDQGPTAVVFIDLDHFRLVNDSRGHAVGDRLLRAVGERLRSRLRAGDTLARFGGDVFVAVCEGVDEAQAVAVAQHLLDAIDETFDVGEPVRHLSASLGVAVSPSRGAEDMLRRAETALHSAKSGGRRRIQVYDQALGVDAEERYALSAALRTALAEDALSMAYQPVVDLVTGEVVGMEALVRWQHPQLGAVPPDRFVGVAEATGLSAELDRWTMRRAIREAGEMRAAGTTPPGAYVALNLSASNLSDRGIEALLVRDTAAAGLCPRDVVVEITETAVMADADVALVMLTSLRDRGFRVAVDDFGTGHSSMAYLRTLPVSTLKIDRAFVDGIVDDRGARAIVTSIVELGRALGLDVVAEGVETLAQARLLRALGADTGQGWLWSPAVPPATASSAGTMLRAYDVDGPGDDR